MPRWSNYEVDKPWVVTSLPDDTEAGMRLTVIDALGPTVYGRAGCHDLRDSLTPLVHRDETLTVGVDAG